MTTGRRETLRSRPRDLAADAALADPAGDRGLAEAFRAGDPGALEEAYRQWSPLVYTMTLRALTERTDAEDVTQEVFVRAWRSRGRFDPTRGQLIGWLVGITRHAIADRLAARNRAYRLGDRLESVGGTSPAAPGSLADDAVNAVLLADGLTRLTRAQRTVIELAFFHGLTHVQIAAATQLPLGTVKSHARRALTALREHMRGDEGWTAHAGGPDAAS